MLCVHSRVSLQCVNTLAMFTAQLWNDWTPILCLCVYMPNFWVVTDVLQCTRPWCSAPKLTHTPHPLPPSVQYQAAGTRGRAAKAGGGEQQGAVTCVTHHTHTTVCIAYLYQSGSICTCSCSHSWHQWDNSLTLGCLLLSSHAVGTVTEPPD